MSSPNYVWEKVLHAINILCEEGTFKTRLERSTLFSLIRLEDTDLSGNLKDELKYVLKWTKNNVKEGYLIREPSEIERRQLIEKLLHILIETIKLKELDGTKKKTKAEQEYKRNEMDRRVREIFQNKLEALETYAEACELAMSGPPPDRPGRVYYSNLKFFLQSFTVPAGSTSWERFSYLKFIQKLNTAGALKPGFGSKIIKDLEKAMEAQRYGEY